jgi:hypothetical protein
MPEFTFKQLKAELEALGFTVKQDASGHYQIYWKHRWVTAFATTHGKNAKRGMVKMPYYRKVLKTCHAFLANNP